jgi:hypothetical protein
MHILYWINISIWVKVSQVSDVAHGPLVLIVTYFLAGLHAYRMVNAGLACGWVGGQASIIRVPTLCNQLLPHLLADILQTLHSC